MAAIGARWGTPGPKPNPQPPRDGRRFGVLIMGGRRGDVFVPSEILICADTLGEEEAIRAWLAGYDIHVSLPCSNTARPQDRA
jgi:hypothetical protein